MQRTSIFVVTVLLCLALAGCDEPATYGLDEASDTIDADDEARRQLLNLRVIVSGSTAVVEKLPSDLVNYVKEDCIWSLMAASSAGRLPSTCNVTAAYTAAPSTCAISACQLQLQLCQANRLMEVAVSPATTALLKMDGNPAATVVPVNAAEAAGVAEQALIMARNAAVTAGGTLRYVTGDTSIPMTLCNSNAQLNGIFGTAGLPTEQTFAAMYASALAESTRLILDASEVAARENVAAADATFDSDPQLRRAARIAQVGTVLSRAHAAHLLVGGTEAASNNLPGTLAGGFHSLPPLTDRAKVARDILRESGISPATLGSTSLDDILVGGATVTPAAGSVRERLAERWSVSTNADGGVLLATTTADSFATMFGLSKADFAEARASMLEEQRIEGPQDGGTVLPARPLAGGATPTWARYATTVNTGNLQLGPRILEGMTRSNTVASVTDDRPPQPQTVPGDWVGSPLIAGRSFAPTKAAYIGRGASAALDYAYSTAHFVLSGFYLVSPPPITDTTARAVLAQLAAEGRRIRTRRIELAANVTGAVTTVRVRVLVDPVVSTDSFLLVDSDDAVQCATLGSVHGAPCNMANYAPSVAPAPTAFTSATSNLTNDTGLAGYHQFVVTSGLWTAPKTYYVLQKRTSGTAVAGPRGYSLLGGFHVKVLSASTPWSHLELRPIVPLLENLALDALRPPSDPGAAGAAYMDEGCAGLPRDQKVPLEDELSEDFNGIESSWRTSLERARTAATRADTLGEQIIADGLVMDARAEKAAQELERLCGASINVEHLTTGLPGPGTTVCTTDADCPVSECAECIARLCTPTALGRARCDRATDPDAARLVECLDPGAIIPLVSFGTHPVCVWRNPLNANEICKGASDLMPCPYFATCATAECPTPDCSSPPGGFPGSLGYVPDPIPVGRRLGLFSSPDAAATDARPANVCGLVKSLRTVTGASTIAPYIASLTASGFFSARTRTAVERIGWRPDVGDRATLTLNGVPWVSSGNVHDGSSYPLGSAWPCGNTAYKPHYMGLPNDIFGAVSQCALGPTRIAWNQRMRNAVIAARTQFGATFDGIETPRVGALGTTRELVGEELLPMSVSLRSYSISGATFATQQCLLNGAAWLGGGVCDGTPSGGTGFSSLPFSASRPGGWTVRTAVTPRTDLLLNELTSAAGNMTRVMTPGPFTRAGLSGYAVDNGSGTTTYIPSLGADYDIDWTIGTMVDGLELACEASLISAPACSPTPPAVTSVNDLGKLTAYLRCVADDLQRRGELTLIANVPAQAVAALSEVGGTATFPGAGGVGAVALSDAREQIHQIAVLPGLIASTLREVANDADFVRNQLAVDSVARRRADIQFLSAAMTNASVCIASRDTTAEWVGGGSGIECLNALAQTVFAYLLNGLVYEELALADERAWLTFKTAFEGRLTTLGDQSLSLSRAHERLNAALARLESNRTEASRYAAQMTLSDSDAMGRQFNLNTAMRRWMDTKLYRYREARIDAVRAAYMAKISLEQRLGVHLYELTDTLSLVTAPSTWENEVCSSTGVDYERLRDSSALGVTNFGESHAFVGDYVTKLENLRASYSVDFAFGTGTDTAVFSLRDDIMNIRQSCEVPVDNLLLQTASLQVAGDPTSGVGGWHATGTSCTTNCAVPNAFASENPFTAATATDLFAGGPQTFRVNFGALTVVPVGAALSQRVVLPPGFYRLSWYAKQIGTGPSPANAMVATREADGSPLFVAGTPYLEPNTTLALGWERRFALFTLSTTTTVRVSIRSANGGTTTPDAVFIAGPMLEALGDDFVPTDLTTAYPKQFAPTGDTSFATAAVCPDTDGVAFRANPSWERKCDTLCSTGFNASCAPEAARTYCYWQTPISISQQAIESGQLNTSGGFARGNFNYRIDSIALNVVGSGARDCGEEFVGAACYATAAVPYSIEQTDPRVRNYSGGSYDAPLFFGRIEHARALAAERYLTNPLSSADRALVDPYLRHELRGRPLDAEYVLRVWDEPGVNFRGIEDIQILINYRYWTRNR